jgi:hypothetical protein
MAWKTVKCPQQLQIDRLSNLTELANKNTFIAYTTTREYRISQGGLCGIFRQSHKYFQIHCCYQYGVRTEQMAENSMPWAQPSGSHEVEVLYKSIKTDVKADHIS